MPKLDWVKDLVRAEEQMEESGIVDLSVGLDNERVLTQETLALLQDLKNEFIDASTSFNEMKASALGRVKIYGIAKTQADFMLFRNGFKMIFSIKEPGIVSIRFNFLGSGFGPSTIPTVNASSAHSLMEENLLIARKGAFGESIWTFQDQQIKVENVVRYHMTLFIKESAK